jgi:hypothetical protein
MSKILITHGSPGVATVAMLQITADGAAAVHHTEPHHIKGLLDGGRLEIIVGMFADPAALVGPPVPVGWHAYLDGDGKDKKLPRNHAAQELAILGGWSGATEGDYLVGPAVFLGEDPHDPAGEGDVPAALLAVGARFGLWQPCYLQGGYTRTAKCRYCAAPIHNRPGQDWWEDDAGLTRCMKSAGLVVGDAAAPTPVPGHEPMPAGLIGEPTAVTCPEDQR